MPSSLSVDHIITLLNEKKWNEAAEGLKAYFAAPWSKEDQGEMYVLLISIYMQIMNRINGMYEETLDEAIKKLEQLATLEQKTQDTVDIQKIQEKIDTL